MILMRTTHKLFFNPAQDMSAIADVSVNEIITSPPYPMIEMWDEILASQNATFMVLSGFKQLPFFSKLSTSGLP